MENSFLPENDALHQSFDIKKNKKNIFFTIISIVCLFSLYFLLISAPNHFPSKAVVSVGSGMSLQSISSLLKNDQIIRSRLAFEFFVTIFGGEKHIVSADYLFENKLPVWEVAFRMIRGEHHMAPLSVTIPEGFDVNQIADTFVLKLNNFNKADFLLKTKNLEGYLFPDTYFFLTNANEEDVIKSMSDNFKKKITPILPQIVSVGKNEKEIITMASLIEGEAKGDTDRGVISGILWRRIKIGMPLQVDSAPETYKSKGLPLYPISNPGLKAINAAINPQDSLYLYYLHDRNGTIHYAKTFAEHEINIKKYLK